MRCSRAPLSPSVCSPGTASVHGLIKTLFPVSIGNSGVLIPLTTESQALFSLPLPAGEFSGPSDAGWQLN